MNECSTDSWYNHPKLVLIFSHFMAAIVFPLHLLGAFCILKRTPLSMSSSKMSILNLHFWNILVDCLMNTFVIPCPLFPTVSGYLLGLFNEFGVRATVQAWILATSLSFVCISTTMIFENRFYLLIARNTRWHIIRPFWTLGNLIFILTYTLPVVVQVPDQVIAKQVVLSTLPCIPSYLKSIDIIVPTLNGTLFIYTAAIFVLVIFGQLVTFTIILIFQLSSNFGRSMLSKTTRRLQRNLSQTLLLQTGIPFVYLLIPLSYGVVAISFQIFSLAMNNLMVVITSFHGLVSTSSMLLIHLPYRRTVFSLFRRAKPKISMLKFPIVSRNHEITFGGS